MPTIHDDPLTQIASALCPSDHDLKGFHLGTLPDPALDGVAAHLETCISCQTRVKSLDGVTDPVLSVLRRAEACGSVLPPDLLDAPHGPDELGRLGHYRVL